MADCVRVCVSQLWQVFFSMVSYTTNYITDFVSSPNPALMGAVGQVLARHSIEKILQTMK